jgi:hypothetical protein
MMKVKDLNLLLTMKEKAFEVWMSYLSEEEKAQYLDYVADCDAADAVWQDRKSVV